MEKNFFGTDGIRGRAFIYPLDMDTVSKFIRVVFSRMPENGAGEKKIAIGMDTRFSSSVYMNYIKSIALVCGLSVIDLGVIPTGAVSWIVNHFNLSGGIVISASHNPYWDNGIKFFDEKGKKYSPDYEEKIFNAYLETKDFSQYFSTEIGSVESGEKYLEGYLTHVSEIHQVSEKMKLGLDFSNGSLFFLGVEFFKNHHYEFFPANYKPDGKNINHECGAVHTDSFQKFFRGKNYDLGICYDGDADRVLFLTPENELIDGDYILALIANYYKIKNPDEKVCIIGTVMSNLGLEKYCTENNILFYRADVGDRNVSDLIEKHHAVAGGEPSGHIIIPELAPTGDGLIATAFILKIISEMNLNIKDITGYFKRMPHILKSIPVNDKDILMNSAEFRNKILQAESIMGNSGRINVRPSGTESKIRIMVEGENEDQVKAISENLIDFVCNFSFE